MQLLTDVTHNTKSTLTLHRRQTRTPAGVLTVEACFRKGFNPGYIFCYRCGQQIVMFCRCKGNLDKLMFVNKLPQPLGPEATIADHAAWQTRLMER